MEKEKKIVKILSIAVLLGNSIIRLMLRGQINNPIEITWTITGIAMLAASLIMIFIDLKISELIATFLLMGSIGADLMLYNVLSPLGNPILLISVLSIILIAIAIIIEEKPKASISSIVSKSKTSTALIVLMLSLSFFINIQTVKASEIVDHRNLISDNAKFNVTLYLYKHEDTITDEDFYGFYILLHTESQAYFDWIEKLELLCSPGATFDDWEPRDGSTTGGSISITPSGPTISIAIPLSDVNVDGEYTNKLNWFINPISLGENPQDLEVAAKVWIQSGTPLYWRLYIKAWSGINFMGVWVFFWNDTLEFSTFPINARILTTEGGTTNAPPGLYSFAEETTITVEAIPTGRGLLGPAQFWKWIVTGPEGTKIYYKDPLTLTLTTGNWIITCYFMQVYTWIAWEFYHCGAGALVDIVVFVYYDMQLNYIGRSRAYRLIVRYE